MEESAAPDIETAVRTAREELAGVVRALTQVLTAVAESDVAEKAQSNADSEAARAEREAALKKRSLAPVMARFDTLRKAVDEAVNLHAARREMAVKEEEQVAMGEREALEERRSVLIAQVRAKNERIKTLIDHLRELHRDIVVLLGSYYKPVAKSGRKS